MARERANSMDPEVALDSERGRKRRETGGPSIGFLGARQNVSGRTVPGVCRGNVG